MSASRRQNSPGLIRQLLDTPEAFELVQALRLLRLGKAAEFAEASAAPTLAEPPVIASVDRPATEQVQPGLSPEDQINLARETLWRARHQFSGAPPVPPPPDGSVARIISAPSLAYQSGELARTERDADDSLPIPTLASNIAGLHGPTGPLPSFVTQAVIAGGRDVALTQVLDFLTDRLSHALVRVAEQARIHLQIEKHWHRASRDADSTDPISRLLLALAGAPEESESSGHDESRAAIESRRLNRFEQSVARFFALTWRVRPIPLTSLQAILRTVLKVPVTILPFEPTWCAVESDSQFRLGGSDGVGPPGRVLGRRARQPQWAILVRCGPMGYPSYHLLLPGQSLLRRIGRIVRTALGPATDFVVQPILSRKDIPRWRLGANGELLTGKSVAPQRLGRGVFLARHGGTHDRDFDGLRISASTIENATAARRVARRSTESKSTSSRVG